MNLRTFNLLALCVLLTTCIAFSQEAGIQFDQANQLYRAGEYQKAVQLYEQVIKNGYQSAALYYNLGNAYFKMNDIPAAIVSYERAKRLAPNDDDIAYNLRLANLRVVDKIEPVPQLFIVRWWNEIVQFYSADQWGIFGIICVWALCLAASSFFLFRSLVIQRLSILAALCFIILTILGFANAVQQRNWEQSTNTAIVFTPTVSVKSAPDEQSTDLFVIHEGLKVELLDVVGNWRKIRLADGKVGWLSSEAIQII